MTDSKTLTHIGDVRTVAIPVADQERALAFYVQQLGFEKRMDAEFGGGQRWIEVAPPGASTSIALARQEGSGTDTGIRLTSSDVAGDHTHLRDLGVDVDAEIIPFPVPMFSFRDADGNRLVIVGDGGQR